MTPLSEFPFVLALGPLVEATLRSTALVAIAALAALALRRAPAAVRHLVWTLALLGCVAMPLAPVLPGWPLPALPAWSEDTGSTPNQETRRLPSTLASPSPGVNHTAPEAPAEIAALLRDYPRSTFVTLCPSDSARIDAALRTNGGAILDNYLAAKK